LAAISYPLDYNILHIREKSEEKRGKRVPPKSGGVPPKIEESKESS
jgi:hypothetical protein